MCQFWLPEYFIVWEGGGRIVIQINPFKDCVVLDLFMQTTFSHQICQREFRQCESTVTTLVKCLKLWQFEQQTFNQWVLDAFLIFSRLLLPWLGTGFKTSVKYQNPIQYYSYQCQGVFVHAGAHTALLVYYSEEHLDVTWCTWVNCQGTYYGMGTCRQW